MKIQGTFIGPMRRFSNRATGKTVQFGSGTKRCHGQRASEARVRPLPLVNDLAHFLKVLKLPLGDSLRLLSFQQPLESEVEAVFPTLRQ